MLISFDNVWWSHILGQNAVQNPARHCYNDNSMNGCAAMSDGYGGPAGAPRKK
ncbi:MAG: hypothetical protein QFF03_15890 [Pseudomonadota bacterium]|nr:hypothetical protein [Pseudomonadota bacterium]